MKENDFTPAIQLKLHESAIQLKLHERMKKKQI